MARSFFDDYHVAFGKNPVADFAMTSAVSDVVNMENYHSVVWLIYWGVGTTGTMKITVEACDDVTPSNTTAIPFKYRLVTGLINAGDTHGAVTVAAVAADGYTTTAGSHQCVIVEADSEQLGDTGKSYIRVKCTEVTDDPILGGILTLQARPRFDVTTSTLT